MIGETLAHYSIVEKLGEGGMGEVYLAEDTRLKRKVALKVLPADMADDPDRLARFKREAETVAALNHPNIVTIHSVEEVEGVHFLTMEWVEGRTLSELLARGSLSLDKLFELATPIADALASAHDKGITHRDLKPANIMINAEGRVKVLDFGLAKLQQEIRAAAGEDRPTQALTQEGLAVGTVPYMSPEQVRGGSVDARSDIFSLGVVLYEMATGRRPFAGESSADLVSSILRDRPQMVSELNAELPHHLGRVISRCLEKNPEKRFQTAKDVRNELEGLHDEVESGVARLSSAAIPAVTEKPARPDWLIPALAAVGVIVLVVAVLVLRGDKTPDESAAAEARPQTEVAGSGPAATDDRQMVVVLPFENLGPADDAYFAAGIADEVNGRLAAVSGLGVISRKTAGTFAESGKTGAQIGAELGVDYVLGGTVRWARNADGTSRVRIAPELIRVADDTQVWTKIYDREMDDIFAVQSEIATKVIDALGVSLLGTEQQVLEARPTDNLEAYQAFLRARDLNENGKTIDEWDRQAVEQYEQAVELDPQFLEAWSRLSRLHSGAHVGYDRTEARLGRARAALEAAEAIDKTAPLTRLARGFYLYYGFRDYDRALVEFEAAGESLPNDAEVREATALIHRRKGNLDKTIELLEQANRLDPRDDTVLGNLASTYRARRETEAALRYQDQLIALGPEDSEHYSTKADYVRDLTGDLEAARRILDQRPKSGGYNQFFGEIGQLIVERDWDRMLTNVRAFEPDAPLLEAGKEYLIAWALYCRDGAEGARQQSEKALGLVDAELEKAPRSEFMHQWRADLHLYLGHHDIAVSEARLAIDLTAKDAFAGPEAEQYLAGIYAQSGRVDEAVELLERLLETDYSGAITVHQLRLEPTWDALRDDPRFQELIEE